MCCQLNENVKELQRELSECNVPTSEHAYQLTQDLIVSACQHSTIIMTKESSGKSYTMSGNAQSSASWPQAKSRLSS